MQHFSVYLIEVMMLLKAGCKNVSAAALVLPCFLSLAVHTCTCPLVDKSL